MKIMSVRDAQSRLAKLADEIEVGESIVVVVSNEPMCEVTREPRRRVFSLEAGQAHRAPEVSSIVRFIFDDFDDPLPEDFLLPPVAELNPISQSLHRMKL